MVTPVDADRFEQLLNETHYDVSKSKFLIDSFRRVFTLQFKGTCNSKRFAPNLKIRVGTKTEMWNKVIKEVKAGRYAGPYKECEIPFDTFIQSPIGLVPKDHGKKTSLIFHLSYPRTDESSVNAGIPKDKCSVKYPDFTDAVRMCLQEGRFAKMGKSDMSMAFRQVLVRSQVFKLLILKAEHPEIGETFFYIDKCLPFGSSISCAIFQAISDSITHIVAHRAGVNRNLLNYLDDYFTVALLKAICDRQIDEFIKVCSIINFPISLEKTFWGTTTLTFLGFLLDTERQLVCLPVEKIQKALNLIELCLTKKKATVKQIQRLTGFLNFICRCVVPGHAFTRCLYALTCGKTLKLHHHISLRQENCLDLEMWKKFLTSPDCFYSPFSDFGVENAVRVPMYSDASRHFQKGFGVWCNQSWTFHQWEYKFMCDNEPSIEYLELYAVTIGVALWVHRFRNRRIYLFCDNLSIIHMLNHSSSSCKNCMVLIRIITLISLKENVRVMALHVKTSRNSIADSLS